MTENTISFNKKTYDVVWNTDPTLKVGIATPVYADPMTRQDQEGIAVIRKIHKIDSDGFIRADVEFADDPGEFVWRFIYTREH